MAFLNNHHTKDEDDRIQILPELDVWSVIRKIALSGVQENPFYVCDVPDLIRKYQNWKKTMPRVTTHYAVKCNDSRIVLETLAALGIGFDCASEGEIRKVLSLGVHPSRIVYANPTKKESYLKYAAAVGVDLMTFDNEHELYKIKSFHPNAKLLIRIKCDDLTALYVFGEKYGCDYETEAADLLKTAFSLDLNVVGVAFHIGSGSKNFSIFKSAFAAARHVFDEAAKVGYDFNLLDIGGGFPGEKCTSIKEIGGIINEAIEEYFPDPTVRITSEPGRYYVNSAFTLVTSIHSLKATKTQTNERSYAYYVDVGVYGGLIPILFDENYSFQPLNTKIGGELYPTVIWGPTCDSWDKLAKNILLPKLNSGDWLVVEDAGAYTVAMSFEFNGMDTPKVHSVIDENNWKYLTQEVPFPMAVEKFVRGTTLDNYRTGLSSSNKFRTNYF
ncbi:ornithine decarboxylase [Anoplophora glabripennis]|nr:ornithine decarboxylase [Anoplophora glabripennis]XP_018576579.1 ornithine decarboxylase [Anoplophora glabripennis]